MNIMKKLYPLLLLLFIGSFSCNTSKPTHKLEIVYDHAASTLNTTPEGYRIRYGGTPTIVIKNINPDVYDVEVDEQQLTTTYEAESSKGVAGADAAAPDPGIQQPLIGAVPKNEDEVALGRNDILEYSEELLNQLVTYDSTKIKYIKKSYQALLDPNGLTYDQIELIKSSIDSTYIPLKRSFLNSQSYMNRQYSYLSRQLSGLDDDEEALALGSALESAFENIEVYDLMSELIEIDQLRSFITENNFRATYHAPVVKADEVIYKLTIETKDENSPTYKKTVIPINVRVVGNWKIDVSSGVMFNMGLTDESYRLDGVDEGDSLMLNKNRQVSDFSPTVGVMTHVYKKQAGYTNYGISFGLGINDEQRLRYYGGVGVMLGEKQRFVISGGLTAAPRAILQGKYHDGQTFEASSAPALEAITEEAYRIGGFLSLTYNLSSNSVRAANNTVQDQ